MTFDLRTGKKYKTYVLTLIPEDLVLVGKAGWIYSARAKALEGDEEIEVLVRLKEPEVSDVEKKHE